MYLSQMYNMFDLGYGQCDAANTLKCFLIGHFVKFFLLIGQSNTSKHL